MYLNIEHIYAYAFQIILVAEQLLKDKNFLNVIDYELAKDWNKFARALEISDTELDIIEEEYDKTRERTRQVVIKWCRKNPNKTWWNIKQGLISIGRNDIVEKCEKSKFFP